MGAITVRTPTNSFSISLKIAAICPWAAVLRKSWISKTLAEATAIMVKKGMKIAEAEMSGLTAVSTTKAKGTRTNAAVETSVFDITIFLELIGKVFVYSSPLPSALNRARGENRAKIAPMDVAMITAAVLSVPKFEISKVIITVSRRGRAKKKAVAGFLEETFRSFRT